MDLENVNKKALVIAVIITTLSVLWYIISPNTSIIILIIVLSIPLLVVLSEFFKNINRNNKKGKLKRDFLNIYWKKNLLFLLIFIVVDIFSVALGNLSFNVRGFPIPYYSQYFQDPSPLFYPLFLIFDILFWYLIAGLIIKKPVEISKNTVRLNYITLIVILSVLFYSFWGLTYSCLIDNFSSDKKIIKECENLSNKQENDQQYSQQFSCYVDYAIKNDNIKLCRLAKHEEEFDLYDEWGYMSKGEEVCYEEVAFRTLNYNICDNIDNLKNVVCTNTIIKAQCYFKVAVAKKDGFICHHIGNLEKDCEKKAEKIEEIMDECYSKVNSK